MDYKTLRNCRAVCSHWYQLIKETSQLTKKFCFRLTLNSKNVFHQDQIPLSIILNSEIKVVKLVFEEDFFEIGDSTYVIDGNRAKINAFWDITEPLKLEETVTELVLKAFDNEPRTNALLCGALMRLKRTKVLEFTMSAFVLVLERICPNGVTPNVTLPEIEHIKIIESNFRRLTVMDFDRLFCICPNASRLDIADINDLIIDENILYKYAGKIKSLGILEPYNIDMIEGTTLRLAHFTFESDGDSINSLRFCLYGDGDHYNLETFDLKVTDFRSTHISDFVREPCRELKNLEIIFGKINQIDNMENRMYNLLRYTPNLKELTIKFRYINLEHYFGHKSINLAKIQTLIVVHFNPICLNCFKEMLRTCSEVKEIRFRLSRFRQNRFQLEHVKAISGYCKKLEQLELMNGDVSTISLSTIL